MVDFSAYVALNWMFFVFGISMFIASFFAFNTYRLSRSTNYLLLAIFMLTSGNHTLQFGALFADYSTYFGRVLASIGNKMWFLLGIIGLALLETSGTKINRYVKYGYYTFSGAIIIHFFIVAADIERFSNLDTLAISANLTATLDILFNFYIQSFLGTAIFTYGIIKTAPINNRARIIRILWLIGIGGWALYYFVDFVYLIIIGENFSAAANSVILVFFVLTAVVWVLLLIYYPENLFISKNLVMTACRLYVEANAYDRQNVFSLGYVRLKQYILSIPDDIWVEGCQPDKTSKLDG